MHNTNLIFTVTGALGAGLLFGLITNSLRLSPIVGYLLAGIAVGPYTPGFIADQQIAEQLAEIGVMLLMFGVGLHFHVEDLWAVRRIAVPGAVAQITVATLLGALVATLWGWSWEAGLVFGLCLSVASTVVLMRILVDNRQLHTQVGTVAVGWLIVEDLFTVVVLVLLPMLFVQSGESGGLGTALGLLTLKIVLLVAAIAILGSKVIPRLFTLVARTASQELFTLTVLSTALGIAVASAKIFDVSMALGAFLAGMAVGKSEFSMRAATEALPLRDAFAVLFFVSVGMLLDPSVFLTHAPFIAATLGVVLVGKTAAAFVLVILLGFPVRVALGVSVALAQIGEFSFILASLGRSIGVLEPLAINVMVAVAIISITLNPLLFRCVPKVENWISNTPWLNDLLHFRIRRHLDSHAHAANTPDAQEEGHVIIVGFGPTGRTLYRLLQDHGFGVSVIELNLETTRKLAREGIPVLYGDASRKEILEAAGIAGARTLILSASSIASPVEIARLAKMLNPRIRIVARTNYTREQGALRRAGCEAVFSGEGEVALALIEEIMRGVGAAADAIERERQRVRDEIHAAESAA